MQRRHNMPFGAACNPDGSVRFRLWAPAARQVDLFLAEAAKHISMPRIEAGWFELVTDAARAGSHYRFRIDGRLEVPDPASRFQPQDVHGPSEVIDPGTFDWQDRAWRGRRWEDAVIYELHVGAFTAAGTFSAARERLDHLADLGITALELMPLADFPGRWNWGYDGVLPFAPDHTYGNPDALKTLVQAAHDRGLMILLDVVYNHFGPVGNYLGSYAPQFFTARHCTPWGDAINFDGAASRPVRDFFIQNALYWLTEYHFDGLRLDAVHAILDDSNPDFLTELAHTVRETAGPDRHLHLILENDRNEARHLQRTSRCHSRTYTAQWNDDIHHALHVLLTGEKDGYYADYAEQTVDRLGRCLTEGFAYQGELSNFRNASRGEHSAGLPPGAFMSFLQNHDQIGNRAFGERLVRLADRRAVRAAATILLLSPQSPLLFMGEEFGAETPFLFFCNFEGELATTVTEGRRNEFAQFGRLSDPVERRRIPDPNAATSFEDSKLRWSCRTEPRHRDWERFYRQLLTLRRETLLSRLSQSCTIAADYKVHGDTGLTARWRFNDGSRLILLANLGKTAIPELDAPRSGLIYATEEVSTHALKRGTLPPWSVAWFIES